MTDLGPLYHWSPRIRRSEIDRRGLLPRQRNIAGSTFHNMADDTDGEFLQPMVCFSLDPATAWNYSHGCWKSVGTFDLWQVHLDPSDEVHIQPGWGARIHEVRVANPIPKRRLNWIGERTAQYLKEDR